jgi:hypothetical protein
MRLPFSRLGGSLPSKPGRWRRKTEESPEQRAACSPDAFRLCANDIPDPKRVENCLLKKKSKLSDQCRLVFEQNARVTAGTDRLPQKGR